MRVFFIGCALFSLFSGVAGATEVRLGCPVRLTRCVDYRSTTCADFNRVSYVGFRLDSDAHVVRMPQAYHVRETAIEYLWGSYDDRYTLTRTTMRVRHTVYVNQNNVGFVAEWTGVCASIGSH